MTKHEELLKYIESTDVYHPKSIDINVKGVCEYANACGKDLNELSEAEVNMFRTSFNEPILLEDMPRRQFDVRELLAYANKKDVSISELSLEEKLQFVRPVED